MEDHIARLESDLKELTNKNDEIEYELEKTRDKAFKLDRQLADTLTKNKQLASSMPSNLAQSSDQNGHAQANNKLSQQNNRNDSKATNLNDKQVNFFHIHIFS